MSAKLYYFPYYDDGVIRKAEIHDWEKAPAVDYFDTFEEAKSAMIEYWTGVHGASKKMLASARKYNETDCS